MNLDVDGARGAIADRVGSRLDLSVEHAALGVSEMVDENMANAARVHAIESGKDLRQRTLIAFGGAAPLHAALGISEMVDENMANAARVHAIESGKDLRPRTLIAFGGAAPLHAARVAEKLGIAHVLIPSKRWRRLGGRAVARTGRLRDRAQPLDALVRLRRGHR